MINAVVNGEPWAPGRGDKGGENERPSQLVQLWLHGYFLLQANAFRLPFAS